MNKNDQTQNININMETVQRILGEKEITILILRNKIDELEKELVELKNEEPPSLRKLN